MSKIMTQEEDEMGRFTPSKGGGKEPREPFYSDEMFDPGHEPDFPHLAGLHVPQPPLNKEKLTTFLVELKPIVEGIQHMKRQDQHLVVSRLQEVKNLLHAGDFSEDIARLFEKINESFNELLTHSRPVDQKTVLDNILELEAKL